MLGALTCEAEGSRVCCSCVSVFACVCVRLLLLLITACLCPCASHPSGEVARRMAQNDRPATVYLLAPSELSSRPENVISSKNPRRAHPSEIKKYGGDGGCDLTALE